MSKTLKLNFHFDACHGWLQVPKSLTLAAKHCSTFSYSDAQNYYLEEDSDAPRFLHEIRAQGYIVDVREIDDGDYSFVRQLP